MALLQHNPRYIGSACTFLLLLNVGQRALLQDYKGVRTRTPWGVAPGAVGLEGGR